MKALGFVEVSGVVAAVDCMDIMCKSADVSFVTWERKLGGRLVTLIVEGSVSDVTEAVECAKRQCLSRVVASNVIAAPHSETVRMVELSASRIKKMQEARAAAEAAAAELEKAEAEEAQASAKPKTTRSRTRKAKESEKSEN